MAAKSCRGLPAELAARQVVKVIKIITKLFSLIVIDELPVNDKRVRK